LFSIFRVLVTKYGLKSWIVFSPKFPMEYERFYMSTRMGRTATHDVVYCKNLMGRCRKCGGSQKRRRQGGHLPSFALRRDVLTKGFIARRPTHSAHW